MYAIIHTWPESPRSRFAYQTVMPGMYSDHDEARRVALWHTNYRHDSGDVYTVALLSDDFTSSIVNE